MLFKDHLKIVTDAGAVLHLGWDYNAPYWLDPLNGVDVDLKTAQGVPHPERRILGRPGRRQSFSAQPALFYQGHPVFR